MTAAAGAASQRRARRIGMIYDVLHDSGKVIFRRFGSRRINVISAKLFWRYVAEGRWKGTLSHGMV